MTKLEDKLPNVQNNITIIEDKIHMLQTDKSIKELTKFLHFDADTHSEFLSSPIDLVERKMFPIPNY
jgi:putative membrane protein